MKSGSKSTKAEVSAPKKKFTKRAGMSRSDAPTEVVASEGLPGDLQSAKTQSELLRMLKVLIASNRERRVFGLLCVRVNALKEVKARFGSAGVEELRRTIYHRLLKCMRTTDVVAVGEGGLFLILANELLTEDDLVIIAERMQRNCVAPCWIKDQEVVITLTAGGVGTEGELTPSEVIGRAIKALDAAAAKGLDFDLVRMPQQEDKGGEVAAKGGNKLSASREAFVLKYIPRFSLAGKISGARVFVELLMESGRGRPARARSSTALRKQRIGDQVLLNVLAQARKWRQQGLSSLTLSVPVGTGQMLDPGFPDLMLSAFEETKAPKDSLELLLTEATASVALAQVAGAMTRLSSAGVRFGLAGFSLDAGTRLDLRKLPFSSLCVSCAPLFKVTNEQESLWLARSVVGVARRCGLEFVAEDVASLEQRDILVEAGCECFEGPFFSPHLTATGLQEKLA